MTNGCMNIKTEKLKDGFRIEIRGEGLSECCTGKPDAEAKVVSFCCGAIGSEKEEPEKSS